GQLLIAAGGMTENPALIIAGVIACIAMLPQFFLFLFYLRKLALRIPNDALASQCMIVMIGLPAAVGLMIGTLAYGLMTKSMGTGIMGVCVGAIALVVFGIWYIILLIWFNRSLA